MSTDSSVGAFSFATQCTNCIELFLAYFESGVVVLRKARLYKHTEGEGGSEDRGESVDANAWAGILLAPATGRSSAPVYSVQGMLEGGGNIFQASLRVV